MRTLDSRFAAARNCIVTKPLRAPAATLARAAASNQLLKGNTLVLHRAPFVSIIRLLCVASLVVGMSSCGGQGAAPGSTPPPNPGSSNPGSNSGSGNFIHGRGRTSIRRSRNNSGQRIENAGRRKSDECRARGDLDAYLGYNRWIEPHNFSATGPAAHPGLWTKRKRHCESSNNSG